MTELKSKTLINLLLVISIVGGLSYWVAMLTQEQSTLLIAWKGLGVGALALWAASQAKIKDGWLIATVMAFGAVGDVLLETSGLMTGALAFVIGHVIAIVLYWRNRREILTVSQKLLALIIVPAVIAIAWLLPADREQAGMIALYAAPLAIMAAMAWTSRFGRYQVGIGAMLFVVSDILIFARMGPLAGSMLPNLLVWPLYFTGQLMIAVGVVRTLSTDSAPQ